MLDVVTIGDIKLDTFVVLDEASAQCQLKMPECQLCLDYGGKIAVEVVDSQIAGSAPNVAIGLSRAGFKSGIISAMGEDSTRPLAMKHLKEEKVDASNIHTVRGEQTSYSVVLNYKGEKTILTSHIRHTYHFPKKPVKARWLYVGEMGNGYEKIYRSIVNFARKNDVILAANPGGIQIAERKQALYDLIKHTHVLFFNKEEAQTVTGEKSSEIHHLATAVYKLGCHLAVITDGKNGSYSFDGLEMNYCPIFPGRLVEATGAGDAFASGFIAALMRGQLHDEALRWGSVNSASVIGFVGPTAGLLSTAQIRSRLRQHVSFRPELI